MTDKVVLTGYGGLLARDLLPILGSGGFLVTALSRAELDVVDSSAVTAALDAVRPVAVVNTAAYTDVDGAERDPAAAERANTRGPEVLARACRTHGVVLLHYSTDFVFDGEADRPYREDDPPRPLGVYGRTKLEGEQRVRDELPDGHLIVRTAWLYGLGGPCFPRTILDAAREQDVLEVVADQVGCPTWTADLARTSAALLFAGARGTVHAAAPDHVSRHGWAAALCDEARRHITLRAGEIRHARTEQSGDGATRPRWSVLDSHRLQEITGEALPSWRENLAPFVRQLVRR